MSSGGGGKPITHRSKKKRRTEQYVIGDLVQTQKEGQWDIEHAVVEDIKVSDGDLMYKLRIDAWDISEETVKVGSQVTLPKDPHWFQMAFNNTFYRWDDAMVNLLGQTVTVVDRSEPGIFGLPKSDPHSDHPIWWYPFSLVVSVGNDRATANVKRKWFPADSVDYWDHYPEGMMPLSQQLTQLKYAPGAGFHAAAASFNARLQH